MMGENFTKGTLKVPEKSVNIIFYCETQKIGIIFVSKKNPKISY